MRVVLVNPPYQTLTSNLGVGHQVPLGLLLVGGALLDAGHGVGLVDAEARRLCDRRIVRCLQRRAPEVVMTGHAGSTPAHPVCVRMLRAVKRALPRVLTVYGGVYPTYHARQILRDEPAVDIIVRGEGEATSERLLGALERHGPDPGALRAVPSIAFRDRGEIVMTPAGPPAPDLDRFRAGWELIDNWDRYQCFGLGRAAIVQFSRGCPHRCTYCGQHGFWVKWRHRDPALVADEVAMLARRYGVRFITLADENPTTSPAHWRALLEEIAVRDTGVRFFATIRASDIVRDEAILPLYRRAGILYVLMGIETTSQPVIESIRKRSSTAVDAAACRLLARHAIRSMVGHIVGFENETWAGFRRARRALRGYGADLVNAMYVTPHTWTAFARESAHRPVVQEDQRLWDYRHQVLGGAGLPPCRLFFAVKWLELVHHATLRRLWRLLAEPDPFLRRQLRWTTVHTGAVWLGEIFEFLFRVRFARRPRVLGEWLGDDALADDRARAPLSALSVDGRAPRRSSSAGALTPAGRS